MYEARLKQYKIFVNSNNFCFILKKMLPYFIYYSNLYHVCKVVHMKFQAYFYLNVEFSINQSIEKIWSTFNNTKIIH